MAFMAPEQLRSDPNKGLWGGVIPLEQETALGFLLEHHRYLIIAF